MTGAARAARRDAQVRAARYRGRGFPGTWCRHLAWRPGIDAKGSRMIAASMPVSP
jgi:hypothetical protein